MKSDLLTKLKNLNLSASEKETLETIFSEVEATGYSKTLRALQNVDWKELPISGNDFIEDPYYFGILSESLYPGVREDFIDIIDRPYPALEVILTGALRWGKSHLSALLGGYHLYVLSCMRDPRRYLRLSPVSTIYFINVSVTGAQASDGVFSTLMGMVDTSPYFREKCPRNTRTNSVLQFSNNVVCKAGNSSEFSAIGKDVYFAILDEANFFGVKKNSARSLEVSGDYDNAKVLYDALIKRIRLTFSTHGVSAGLGVISSSARYPQDYIERKVDFVESLKKSGEYDGTIVVKKHSNWEVKDPSVYTLPKFRVQIGDTTRRAKILDPGDESIGKVLDIPGELKSFFLEDIDAALRDIAGVPTASISPFFKNREAVNLCFTNSYEHPFAIETSVCLEEPLILERIVKQDELGRYRPIYNPGVPRGIHIDLAKTGQRCPFGFVMGHIAGYKEVQVVDEKTFKIEKVTRPIIRMDLVLQIIARPNTELEQSKIIRLIFLLRLFGFNISFVTADQYQSANILQTVSKKGIEAKVMSHTYKKFRPYTYWKEAVYEGRFVCYNYSPLQNEMISLEDREGIIDHPANGTDDLCVGVAVLNHELHERYFASDNRSIPQDSKKIEPTPDELVGLNTSIVDLEIKSKDLLSEIDPDYMVEVNNFIYQRIPLDWDNFSPLKRYQMRYLLQFKATEFADLGRFVFSQVCLTELERVKQQYNLA